VYGVRACDRVRVLPSAPNHFGQSERRGADFNRGNVSEMCIPASTRAQVDLLAIAVQASAWEEARVVVGQYRSQCRRAAHGEMGVYEARDAGSFRDLHHLPYITLGTSRPP